VKKYHPNGNVKSNKEFDDEGQLHGKMEEWYANGHVRALRSLTSSFIPEEDDDGDDDEGSRKRGSYVCVCVCLCVSCVVCRVCGEQKCREECYEHGVLNGEARWWHEAGGLWTQQHFLNVLTSRAAHRLFLCSQKAALLVVCFFLFLFSAGAQARQVRVVLPKREAAQDCELQERAQVRTPRRERQLNLR
jgi:hypothetical protein